MPSISGAKKSRGRPKVGSVSLNVRMPPDELELLDRFIAEHQPDMSRPEALRHAFREWVSRTRSPGATDAQIGANADRARSHAAAADAAMSGMEATKQGKATRRGALTGEPPVVEAARGKGRA